MSESQSADEQNSPLQTAAVLETILHHLNSGVLVFDESGKLAYHNPAAREVLRQTEMVGEGPIPDEYAALADLLEMPPSQASPGPLRWEMELEGGRFYEARLSPLPGEWRLLQLQEISNFKRLDRIKTEFVNDVSHDLRSPLTAILGYVGLIDRVGPVNEDQKEFIQRAQTSVETIENMIDKLLDLGRIEAGYDEEMIEVSAQQLIDSSVEAYRAAFAQKNQHLRMDTPAAPVLLLGNPPRLRQALDNLLENAVNYTPAGGEVFIRTWVEGEQAILQVQDTGVGIPASDLPHIFDKLYRGANISAITSGAGLGLSIVKSIVEGHQGRVWAKSKPEEGSTFTVVLPLYTKKTAERKELT